MDYKIRVFLRERDCEDELDEIRVYCSVNSGFIVWGLKGRHST